MDESMGILVEHQRHLPSIRKTKDYEHLIADIHSTGARIQKGHDTYYLRDTHTNKCFFYSLLHDAFNIMHSMYDLCVLGRIEMAVTLT